jgi:hypothetical protein
VEVRTGGRQVVMYAVVKSCQMSFPGCYRNGEDNAYIVHVHIHNVAKITISSKSLGTDLKILISINSKLWAPIKTYVL